MMIRSCVEDDRVMLEGIADNTPEFDDKDRASFKDCLRGYFAGNGDYFFACAEDGGRIMGVACYGWDSIAESLIEVYWITVSKSCRRMGVGKTLLKHIEEESLNKGARMVVIETESTPSYAKSRLFYEKNDYKEETRIRNYYSRGNDKVIYTKQLPFKSIEHVETKPEWKSLLADSINNPGKLPRRFRSDVAEINEVTKRFPMRVNPYYASLIEYEGDPIWKQCMPDKLELEDFGVDDPLNEEGDSPVPGLTHRYPDRVLLLVSNQCAMYCRFCTRKRKVGDPYKTVTMEQIQTGISYIRENPQIRDVILSGGDPLMLSDRFLERILKELRSIPHLQVIRIGTRVPCTLPQRITEELCGMLAKYHPLYVNMHFNHPREITPESRRACSMLANAGIPLGCQTVLLKGVNDNPQVLKELMQKLVDIRVKPYYLYQCDLARGNEHFRTPVSAGLEVIENIRGHTSGLCVPQFVIDAPGGGGKIPLQPKYVLKTTKRKIVLRNYKGQVFEYPEPIFLTVRNKRNELGIGQVEDGIQKRI